MGRSLEGSMRGNRFRPVSGMLILTLLLTSLVVAGFGSPPFVLAQEDPAPTVNTQDTSSTPADRDADGVPDDQDACPDDPANLCDLPSDVDGDATPDDQDTCPNDPTNTCNLSSDTDGDGLPDDQDMCPQDPTNACAPPLDTDSDGDGIPDDQDVCPNDPANQCATETTTGSPAVIETPVSPGTPEALVQPASVVFPAPPSELVRLPFAGTWTITGGPEIAECSKFAGHLHYQGGYPINERAIDFAMPNDTPIYAAGVGTVVYTGGTFNQVDIAHASGLETHYLHLSQVLVSPGNGVSAGTLIGYSGDTGSNGAYHLHFSATSSSGASVDIRGMPGLFWDPAIEWTGDGFIGNCVARVGMNEGSADGGAAPVTPPATKTPTPTSGGFPAGSKVKTTTSNVNMRKGAGTGYGILYTLGSGANCTVLEGPTAANGYQWYRLDCGSSRVGWVAGSFLALVSSGGPTPTKVPTPKPAPTKTTGGFPAGAKVKTTTSNVKMRKGAGTGYGILYTLGSGANCTVREGPTAANGYQWYRLDCGSSRVGWVAGSFLTLVSSGGPTPTKTPTKTSTPTSLTGAFAGSQPVRITTGNVKMRTGAGVNYGVVLTLQAGDVCFVIGGPVAAGGFQWYKLYCDTGDTTGWVAGSYLAPLSVQDIVTITTSGNLKMRSNAGLSNGVLYTLSNGTQCVALGGPVFADGYQWYRLDCGSSRIGWVAGAYLEFEIS